jgi:hypothetical protein
MKPQQQKTVVQSTIPTWKTCPPPSPFFKKQVDSLQDDIFSSIMKGTPSVSSCGSLQRTRSAEAHRVTHVTTPTLQRSSSGSDTRGWEGYCDAPSFSLGTEFDMPNSQPVATSTSSCDIDVLEDIDLNEIEKLCVEAELARKNHSIKQKVTAPDNFNTPIRDSASGDSTVGVEGSSTGPTQYERRIIKAPACKKSPYIDTNNKKQYSYTTEVNKLYALVIQHGRRKTRQQSQEEEERSVLKFTVLLICCL